jgi:3-deoxy-7-phosphoheptulonate synthase
MIIVMKQNAPLTAIETLEAELRDKGFQVDRSRGSSKVVLGLVGDTSALDERDFLSNPWVDKVMRVQEPYKRASRAFHPADTVVEAGGREDWRKETGGHGAVPAPSKHRTRSAALPGP